MSYWPLDETSGTRYDAVGSNDLTDNNTVGAKLRGPEGTAASFVAANSESLSKAGVITPQSGVTYTLAAWVNPAPAGWFTFDIAGPNPLFLRLQAYDVNDGRLFVQMRSFDGAAYRDVGAYVTTASYGGWNLLVGEVTQPGTVQLWLNGEAVGTPVTATQFNNPGASNFTVGQEAGGSYSDGSASSVALYSRALTSDERTDLFASGNGLRYADLPAGLLSGLVSWWELDEVSGVRYDSHGANDLTDNNTVGSVNSGPKGVVSLHDGNNNENFSCAWTPTAAWSVVGWTKQTGEATTIAEWGTAWAANVNGLQTLASGGGHLQARAWQGDGTNYSYATATKLGGLGAWGFCAGRYDGTKIRANVDVDFAAEDVADGSSATGAGTLYVGTGGFSGQPPLYGRMANLGIWSRSLTDGELVSLFNSGRDKRYADLTDGEKVGLVSYWNLDEASGVRYDSHGTNHLTDNNTVLSAINAGDAMDGAAASFVAANSEKLTRADTTGTFGDGVSQTFSFWFKDTTAGTTGGAVIARDNATTREWAITTGNTTISVLGFDSGGNPVAQDSFLVFSDTFTKNQWHHAVVWYDFSDSKFHYQVDGGVVRDFPTTLDYIRAGTGPLEIGASTYYNQADLTIDEVAIWDRVLTADERAELFNLGRGKFYDFA